MKDPLAYFITWTTYGTWLPGDSRGWLKWKTGLKQSQPALEKWCRNRMKEKPVFLDESHRNAVEEICLRHSEIRGWKIYAINARSNHVHIAVAANAEPKKIRDQLKANATRVLRQASNPIANDRTWTRGGDIQFINNEDELEQVILYITKGQ